MLLPGDVAPYFRVASSVNSAFNFDTAAGRYIILSFLGSTQIPSSARFIAEISKRRERLDVTNAIFFGVTNDQQDVQRLKHEDGGRVYFYDLDLAVTKRYGLIKETEPAAKGGAVTISLARKTFVLDQALRVIEVFNLDEENIEAQVVAIFALLDSAPPLAALQQQAPVIIVPQVFEPELCAQLIQYYNTHDVEDSGFMREVDGKTVGLLDYSHKRRMDCEITDEKLIRTTQERIKLRIVPAIQHAYQFTATRIERHIVACYDAAQGAHFRAHRDNTTLGTAHRRFAITINLNSADYEGGEIWFPEFGPKKHKPASGSAIVFSCSLLHEVPKVTRGKRFAFLPFLYDDTAAALRERNRKYVGDLSGAAGAKVTHVCDSTAALEQGDKPIIDGSAGCGNPEGCETCLTSATYQIGQPQPTIKSADPNLHR